MTIQASKFKTLRNILITTSALSALASVAIVTAPTEVAAAAASGLVDTIKWGGTTDVAGITTLIVETRGVNPIAVGFSNMRAKSVEIIPNHYQSSSICDIVEL